MRRLLLLSAALCIGMAAAAPGYTQAPAAAPLPAASALPNWSGTWEPAPGGGYFFDKATSEGANVSAPNARIRPPYTPEWETRYAETRARIASGAMPDPISTCGTPAGWPRMLNLVDAYEFVVRPEQTWILAENGPNVVRIYTDGRGHMPDDEIWHTYTGDSVGKWEGDTLVFETIAMNGAGKTILDRTGAILSDSAKVNSRMRLAAPDTLEITMVITDPVALTRPWTVTRRFKKLDSSARIYDYACAENNRNPIDEQGRTLTLDADGKVLDKFKQD
jgi:hypothetical protein